jgi:hypothetical protein
MQIRSTCYGGDVKYLRKTVTISVPMLLLLALMPASTNAQMSKVKTVWVILMENHNWTGNNAGAAFGTATIASNKITGG